MIRAALDAISLWAIPVMLVGIPLYGMIKKVKVYDVFVEGAKEGFEVAVKIIPFLVGILVAIGMFRGPARWTCTTPRSVADGRHRLPAELVPGHPATSRQRLARLHDRPDQNLRPDSLMGAGRHDVRPLGNDLYVMAVYSRHQRQRTRHRPGRSHRRCRRCIATGAVCM